MQRTHCSIPDWLLLFTPNQPSLLLPAHPADGPLKAAPESVSQQPGAVWLAAAFEQMLENAVVLAREADKQLGLVEEDSKVRGPAPYPTDMQKDA